MIVGFKVDSMEASKAESAQGNLQINYRPEIVSAERATVQAFDDEVARIEYSFRVSYQAGNTEAAFISMEGHVLWNGDTEEIIEAWEEDESLPEDVNAPLMNELYRRLLSESVGVANTLGLLPPIPTPTVD